MVAITKEFLIEEYIGKNKSSGEIGDILDLTGSAVRCHLKKYGIVKDTENYFNKEFLEQEYILNGKTCDEIANELGVCSGTIQYHIKKHGIIKDRATLLNKDFLEEEYINKNKSVVRIAKELNLNEKTVQRYLDKYIISKDSPSKKLTKEIIEDLYINQKLSVVDIAKILNIKSFSSVKQAVSKYGFHRDRIKCKRVRTAKSWKGFEEISGRYLQSIRNRCKQYDIECNYTQEYIWDLFIKQNRKCVYSGIELEFAKVITNDGIKEQTASLDRIDSSKGYIIGNLQWLHKDVNKMKMDLSDKYFREICIKIANNLGSVPS